MIEKALGEGVIDRVRLRSRECQCQSHQPGRHPGHRSVSRFRAASPAGPRTTFLGREKTVGPANVVPGHHSAKSALHIFNEHQGFLPVHPPFIRRPKAISALLNGGFGRAYARPAQASAALPGRRINASRGVVARGLTENCRQPTTHDGPGATAPCPLISTSVDNSGDNRGGAVL